MARKTPPEHSHSSPGDGGGKISPDELGMPKYDDVSNAPQVQGHLVYATGNGTSSEGVYKHDGTSYASISGASALSGLSIDSNKDWGGYNITNAGNLSTTQIDGPGRPYSTSDDLSDITVSVSSNSPTNATNYTVLDVSDGPKVCLNIGAMGGNNLQDTAQTSGSLIGPVTVDGQSNATYPSNTNYRAQDTDGTRRDGFDSFAIQYDSSLKIEWRHQGDGNIATVYAMRVGSGPDTAAVVQDGEPVHSVHTNVTFENFKQAYNVPDGYKLVKNPDLSHHDPQIRGAWDDANDTVVDHPYWAPFHDHLDNIRTVADQYGPREYIKNVDTPSDRGNMPVRTPDWTQGNSNPDPSVTDHIKEDAMAFEKARWDDELPSSI